jgi:transposase
MVRRYGWRDDQWEQIEAVLPGREGTVGVTAKDNRRFVEAVMSRYRAGLLWRELPERFGEGNPIARRQRRWAVRGGWRRIFAPGAAAAENADAMIDSTLVRAHQHAAGAKGGTGRARAAGAARAD